MTVSCCAASGAGARQADAVHRRLLADGLRGTLGRALAVVEDGRVVEKVGWLIRPPAGHDVFSEWNIRIHGITPDRVVDAAGWADQMDDLLAAIGERPVVAHNARFDMGVMRAACFASGVVGSGRLQRLSDRT